MGLLTGLLAFSASSFLRAADPGATTFWSEGTRYYPGCWSGRYFSYEGVGPVFLSSGTDRSPVRLLYSGKESCPVPAVEWIMLAWSWGDWVRTRQILFPEWDLEPPEPTKSLGYRPHSMPYSLLPLPKLWNLERNLLTSPTPLSDLRERQAGRLLPVVLYPIILPIYICISQKDGHGPLAQSFSTRKSGI